MPTHRMTAAWLRAGERPVPLVLPGSHGTWLAAVMIESALVAIGVFLLTYARYLGGTLLAVITLGALLHPAVSRAFSPGHAVTGSADRQPGLADAATELRGSAASP